MKTIEQLHKELAAVTAELDAAITITGVEAAFIKLRLAMNALNERGEAERAKRFIMEGVRPETQMWFNREILKSK